MTSMFGTIKNLVATRGFGFIRRDDGQPDCFFHANSLTNRRIENLIVGERVEFEIGEVGARGPRASSVTVL